MTIRNQHLPLAQGPLGFPLPDKQARVLDALLKTLPKGQEFAYRRLAVEKAPTELLAGERSDVSWISTEDCDRVGDVVIAKGMNDSQFKQNPIVTLQHCYDLPPVGKSLWRKYVKDGEFRGIKAKTLYPTRPKDWVGDWPADIAFSLVQAGLLNGKSIGFLPTKVHVPDSKELEKRGWSKQVQLVIDEWLLLEYACVYLPMQQNALVEEVAKSIPEAFLKVLNLKVQPAPPPAPVPISHLEVSDLKDALHRALATLNPQELLEATLAQKRGRV